MEIVEVIKPKENETISKIEFFEVENLDENSLNNEKEKHESINKPETKYPTSSSIYQNKDGSASINFGNYKTINIESEFDNETESEHVNVVNIEEPEIVLNIETV